MSVGNMGVVGRGDFDAAQPGPQGPTGATGGLVTINKTAHGFTLGQCVRYSPLGWTLARADSEDTLAIGVVVSLPSADTFIYAMTGRFEVPHGLENDTWYYLSADVNGGLTSVRPGISQPIVLTDDASHLSVMQYRPDFNRPGDDTGGTEGPAGPRGLQGPKGDRGSRGLQGQTGPRGPFGYEGATGSVGPEGQQGIQGNTGSAATVNAGYTATLSPDSAALVTNSGTSSEAVFDFAIPQGDMGPAGLTGPQGAPGTGVVVRGVVPTIGDLPSTATAGDVWIVSANDEAYVWTEEDAWLDIGTFGLYQEYLPLTGGVISGQLEVSQVGSGINTTSIGKQAGYTGQQDYGTAYGLFAGQTSQGNSATAIGPLAGSTDQGMRSVAVGNASGRGGQGTDCVAVGNNAGRQNQGSNSVAIGSNAGREGQGTYGIILLADTTDVQDTSTGHIHIKSFYAHLSYTKAEAWNFSDGNVNVSSLSVGGVPLADIKIECGNAGSFA